MAYRPGEPALVLDETRLTREPNGHFSASVDVGGQLSDGDFFPEVFADPDDSLVDGEVWLEHGFGFGVLWEVPMTPMTMPWRLKTGSL